MLAESGRSYEEIGRMTPDQVCHRLCNDKVLRSKGGCRVGSAHPLAVTPNGQGLVKGRAEDGSPIMARMNVGGKSLARRLMDEEEAKERAER